MNSSVEISDNAKRLYEQSQKNITSNPDWTTDTTITSIDLNKLNLGQQKSLQNSQVQPNIQISSATFSDPDMRPQLQAYYESKKTDLNEFIKGQKVEVIPFSKWLEFSAQSFQENDSGPLSIQAAQQNIENAKQNSPDSSSHVEVTFSDNETLLAYIDSNGGLVTHSSSGLDTHELTTKADTLGLSGEKRIDYLGREIEASLISRHQNLKVTTYDDKNIPSKREFSKMWYPTHDVDTSYRNNMSEALEMLQKAQASHFQFHRNINDIQEFILNLQ